LVRAPRLLGPRPLWYTRLGVRMKFDFLGLLESIVQGFLAFVYSVLRSMFLTLRRPVRGPLRLHGFYRVPHHRQIGGVSFLYLGCFLAFYLALKTIEFSSEAVLSTVWQAIVDLPKIEQEDLWPILAGSLIATTVIDAGLRLWLSKRWRRRRRRELLVAACEYSLFWAALPGAVVGWYLVQVPAAGWSVLAALPWWAYLLAALLPVAALPTSIYLTATSASLRGRRTSLTLASASLAIALGLAAACSAGTALERAIMGESLLDPSSAMP